MNRMLRITTFLVALVVLAIAAPLAQADPWQFEQDNQAAVARDGHLPSNAASQAPASDIGDGWQGKYIVGGEVVTGSTSSATHPDNRPRFVPADTTVQTPAPQSGSEINWSDAGYGFGAGLLLAVLVGGAVVMSGRAGRGELAHS